MQCIQNHDYKELQLFSEIKCIGEKKEEEGCGLYLEGKICRLLTFRGKTATVTVISLKFSGEY